jgi:2,4-dienoyl-CoA reductase-like NADH-dependent reductase (Old Yellow Enzyme family)
MCEYSCEDGFANDWHFVHLGSRAVGGAGLVMAEATAVQAEGRITHGDLGIYKDEHVEMLRRIATFIKGHGAVPAIQLAHAGRKASCETPWNGGAAIAPDQPNGWQVIAPSPVPFKDGDPIPHELTVAEIARVVEAFAAATRRALAAGFEVIEIHGAHGYLTHEFLSPLSNFRTDQYGGSFANRARLALEITEAVRKEMSSQMPLFMRISCTDWAEGGWTIEDSVELAKLVKPLGVDLMDCSSGNNIATAQIPFAPGFQVPFAERIRKEAGMLTGAVGLITEPKQAEAILLAGQADVILLAREMLRDPYFPMHAAQALGVSPSVPRQYLRAFADSTRRN